MAQRAGRPQANNGIGIIARPLSAAGLGVAGPVFFLMGVGAYVAGLSIPFLILCSVCVAAGLSRFYWHALLSSAAVWTVIALSAYFYASAREQQLTGSIRLPLVNDRVSVVCESAPYPSYGGAKCNAKFQAPFSGTAYVLLRPGWMADGSSILRGNVTRISNSGMEINIAEVAPSPSILQKGRDFLAARMRAAIAEPHASLLLGAVFGRGLGFDRSFKDKMIKSGTIHLVAVSGFNIVVLAGVLQGLGYSISRAKLRFMFVNLPVWMFVLFAGAPISAIRAAVMFTAGDVSYLAGRGVQPATGVVSAAAIITIFSPPAIGDVGFLLSFASILGLSFFSGPISNILSLRISSDVAKSVAPSLAAQLGVLPVSVFVFGQVSAATIPANILASFIVQALFLASVIASAFASLGLSVFAWLAGYPVASVMVWLVNTFSTLPQFNISGSWSILIFCALWSSLVVYLITKQNENAH